MDPLLTSAMQTFDCSPGNYFNVTNEIALKLLQDPYEDVLHAVIVPFLMLVGLLFNSAFIHAVRKVPRMQTVTNAYLVNVSIADLMFGLTGGFFILWSRFSSLVQYDAAWIGSRPGCFSVYFTAYWPYFTSILLITSVTVERYNAICRPLKQRQSDVKYRAKKIAAASWLIGAVLAAISVLQYSGYKEVCLSWPVGESFDSLPTRVGYCTSTSVMYVLSDSFTVIPFFTALIICIVMYTRIIMTLSRRSIDKLSGSSFTTQSRNIRNQVARLLIVNGTVFFLLQAPFRLISVQNLLVHLTGEGFFTAKQYDVFLFYGRSFLFVNSLINPLVYVCISAQYRAGFIEIFTSSSESNIVTSSGSSRDTWSHTDGLPKR